jgi:uncharacterized membrane protein YhaH (DUF805 family)
MKEYIDAWKKYAVFSGRAPRKEFWMFVLGHVIVSMVLGAISSADENLMWVMPLYGLAVLLPALGLTVRRLHDTGKSGWWLLLSLVPLIGSIVLLVFYVTDSQPGSNKYGPNPKGVAAPASTPPAAPTM